MANLELIEKKDIEHVFEFIQKATARIETLTFENLILKEGYMTTQQVIEYTGYGIRWVESRQERIGYTQDGKEKRFKRADVDAYMLKNKVQRKY